MTVAQQLAPLSLKSLTEDAVPLGSFWADKPVVLVFLRHFG